MGLALALDEPRYIKGLDSIAMDSKPTLGQRLVDAVIPSRAPAWLVEDMRALLLRWDSDGESVSCKRYSESA